MLKVYFFPIFLFIAFALTLIYIPRQHYKKHLIYAVISGGLGDMINSVILVSVLKLGHYAGIGIFNVYGYNYLSPFAWTFVQMLFLYFLPVRRWFLYGYILGFIGISIGFGLVIRNLGILVFDTHIYHLVAPLVYLVWWTFTAWLFRRSGNRV